ncbi:hypothetical protein Daus18300_005939 [Diaporthe australafricana]|uniref:Gfd2/YDR514C-like C-terminal domain-containing protein n=1 Tax=Diaporthe australafricana TaxID=127596 RepID=A0ABR3WYE1_9PEZI
MTSPHMDQEIFSVTPSDGGLEAFERLFRISDSPSTFPQDALIVSIDLEASGGKRNTLRVNRKQVKGVREVGFAVLDTRSIFPSSSNSQPTLPPIEITNERSTKSTSKQHPLISTQQFSTSHASEDFEDCDITDFRECVFARTRHVRKEDLVDTITRCLQFQEDPGDNPERHSIDRPVSGLRTIVIVGHSPQHDLEIIRRLGVQMSRTAPVAAVLDTHRLSKSILGPGSPAAEHHPPLQKHALTDVLTELDVPYSWHHLHNAGNDATYTLHALIMLAIRWAESTDKAREGLTSKRLEQLRAFAEAELKAPRWKPIRRALGAHHVGKIPGDIA